VKVEQKEVTKLVITDTEHVHYSYGAINVYLEDFGLVEGKYHSGKILIECDGDSWAKYWFSMGCGLIEFLSSTSVNYLTNKLVPSDECYEVDMDELTKELKQELFKQRREKDIDDYEARQLYEDIESMDCVTTEQVFISGNDTCEKILGDEWYHDIPTKHSTTYNHVENIVKAVKDAIEEIKEDSTCQK
jgi:hypothetical protein